MSIILSTSRSYGNSLKGEADLQLVDGDFEPSDKQIRS